MLVIFGRVSAQESRQSKDDAPAVPISKAR
jgi:hypothetical protein